LVEDGVQLVTEPFGIDPRCARERLEKQVATDVPSTGGTQFADGDASTGHEEHLAAVERTHDRSAVVAEFTLADDPGHTSSVALV